MDQGRLVQGSPGGTCRMRPHIRLTMTWPIMLVIIMTLSVFRPLPPAVRSLTLPKRTNVGT